MQLRTAASAKSPSYFSTGNNDGCAISRKDEAKALDIRMGTPGFMLEEHIRHNNLKVFSSNYALYRT